MQMFIASNASVTILHFWLKDDVIQRAQFSLHEGDDPLDVGTA
jgi:hypothetical protein